MAFFSNLLAMMRKPAFPSIPLYPPGQDMSWIPDYANAVNITTQYATEAPLGRVAAPGVTFTFTSAPKFIIYNSAWLKAGIDFLVVGTVVTMPVSLSTDDELYAIV